MSNCRPSPGSASARFAATPTTPTLNFVSRVSRVSRRSCCAQGLSLIPIVLQLIDLHHPADGNGAAEGSDGALSGGLPTLVGVMAGFGVTCACICVWLLAMFRK